MTTSILLSVLLSTMPGAIPQSQAAGFAKVAGWSTAISGPGIPQYQSVTDYVLGRDASVSHDGHPSVTIEAANSSPEGWRCLMQGIRANNYRGKRIRLSGFLKTKDVVEVAGDLA